MKLMEIIALRSLRLGRATGRGEGWVANAEMINRTVPS